MWDLCRRSIRTNRSGRRQRRELTATAYSTKRASTTIGHATMTAGLQRFGSEAPIGFGGGDVNLYGYARSAPLRLRDPLGLDPAGAHDRCSYGRWGHLGERGWMRVYATRKGLVGQRTASGHLLREDDIFG